MKTTILFLVVAMVIPAVSSAKVEDFNSMISENNQAQVQLREDLKEQMAETRQAQLHSRKMIALSEDPGANYNSVSNKSLTTFEKEMVHYRPSEKKQMNRLAAEIRELEY